MTYIYEYPRPSVTCDVVVRWRYKLLLVQRKNDPHKDRWAFPGGFMEIGELLKTCAQRELEEETGLKPYLVGSPLEYVSYFDDIHRDSRGRVITHLFTCSWPWNMKPKFKAADDAAKAELFDVSELYDKPQDFWAFDHREMFEIIFNKFYLNY
jgi:8-oxo-dGTP diphosphatase